MSGITHRRRLCDRSERGALSLAYVSGHARSDEHRDCGRAGRARRPVRAGWRRGLPDRRLPERRQGDPRRARVGDRARARGPRHRARRRRPDHPGEDHRARRHRRDPDARQDAGEVSAGPDRDHPPSGTRAQARAAAVRRARDRLPRVAPDRRRGAQDPRAEGLRPEGRRGDPRQPAIRRGRRAARPDRAEPGARRRRAAGGGAARAPGRDRCRAGGVGPADDRHGQGPRCDRHRDRSARAGPGGDRARPDRGGRDSIGGRRPAAYAHGRPRRPADRGARPVRQPAPAPDRLQAAQHGAARHGRAQGPARVRVRGPRRRDRRDPPLRHRARGLRAARPRVHRPRAAREPRRARGRGRRHVADADRARRPPRRSALAHDRVRRDRVDRGDGARGAGLRLRVSGDHRPLGELRFRGRGSPSVCASRSRASAPPASTASSCSPARR